MSVPRNVLLSLLPQAVLLTTGIATSVLTARYLGPAGRGVLSLAVIALGVLQLLADLGISAAITYHVSGGRLRRDEWLRFCALAALALGAGAFGMSLALFPLLATSLMRGVSFEVYVLSMASVAPLLFIGFWKHARMASGEFAAPAVVQVAMAIGTVALAVGVFWYARLRILEFVAGLTLLHLVVAASVFRFERGHSGFAARLPKGFLRQAISYGTRSYLGSVVSYATLRLDTFLLNAFGTNADVGRYTVAVTLGEKLWVLDASLGEATLPEVVSRRPEEAADLTATSNRIVLMVVGSLGVLFFILAPGVIRLLYGNDFMEAALALRILLPGIVAFASARQLLQYHQGQLGRPGTVSLVKGASAAVGVSLYFLLIPTWGWAGAAWASTAAYSVMFLVGLVFFVRETGVRVREVLVPKLSDLQRMLRIAKAARE